MNTHSKGEMSRRIHQTNLGCLKRERIGILCVVRGESSIREIRTLSYVSSDCGWLVGLQVIFLFFIGQYVFQRARVLKLTLHLIRDSVTY